MSVETLLRREDQGVLGKVYREYSGSLVLIEYKTEPDTAVGGPCLKRTYTYNGSRTIGEDVEEDTWTQTMEDGTAGTNFLQTYSVSFDGVDEQLLGTDNSDTNFERTEAFSISFWYKTTSTSEQTIIAKQDVSTQYRGWRVYILNTGAVAFELVSDAGTSNRIMKQNTIAMRDGQWRHICFTYSGNSGVSGINMYVNGAAVGTSSSGTLSATISNSVPIRVGTRASLDTYFNGKLDEMAIWNKALSAAEVWEMMQEDYKNYDVDHSAKAYLINWWRMGDGDTHPTITDNSTQSFGRMNLTMTNMAAGNIVEDSDA